MQSLIASLESAPVIRVRDYDYFVHPLTDGVPLLEPSILNEAAEGMLAVGDFDCDAILTPDAMGIPLATALSLRTGRPFSVVRKRRYGLPGEMRLKQRTGYSGGDMFVNGLRPGDRVTIVDDVISTGGTLKAIIPALRQAGVIVVDAVVAVEKGDGRRVVEEEVGVPVRTLVRVEIEGGRVRASKADVA